MLIPYCLYVHIWQNKENIATCFFFNIWIKQLHEEKKPIILLSIIDTLDPLIVLAFFFFAFHCYEPTSQETTSCNKGLTFTQKCFSFLLASCSSSNLICIVHTDDSWVNQGSRRLRLPVTWFVSKQYISNLGAKKHHTFGSSSTTLTIQDVNFTAFSQVTKNCTRGLSKQGNHTVFIWTLSTAINNSVYTALC